MGLKALTLMLLAAPAPTQAESASESTRETAKPETLLEPQDDARRHFDQGVVLYEEGDLPRALYEFQRAFELSDNYRLLYNIGVTQLELRDYASALRSFRSYLEQGGADVPEARRAEVVSQVEALRRRVGSLIVLTSIDGAEILIDGRVIGTTPMTAPVLVNIGPLTLEVRAKGYEPWRQAIAISSRDEIALDADLVRVEPPKLAMTPVESPLAVGGSADVANPSTPRIETVTWSLFGATAVVGFGALVTGLLAIRAEDDFGELLDQIPADPTAVADAESRRNNLAYATDGLLVATVGLGLATLGTGIAAVVRKRRGPKDDRRIALTPLGFHVRF